MDPRTRGALISDTQPAEPAAVMEMAPGGMSRTAADRLAALTVRGAHAACAMIHPTDGPHMRLIGGHAVPAGFEPMRRVPIGSTLGGLLLRTGFPVVIADVETDDRVPAEAPAADDHRLLPGTPSTWPTPASEFRSTSGGTSSTASIAPRGARPGTNVHVELPRDRPPWPVG